MKRLICLIRGHQPKMVVIYDAVLPGPLNEYFRCELCGREW